MYREMKIRLPEEIYLILKKNEYEMGADILLKASIQYYMMNQLSLERAANMCGLTRMEFIEVLNSINIPVFNYALDDVDEIHEESRKILECSKL